MPFENAVFINKRAKELNVSLAEIHFDNNKEVVENSYIFPVKLVERETTRKSVQEL